LIRAANHSAFVVCALRYMYIVIEWHHFFEAPFVGRLMLAMMLVALNVYASVSSYKDIGDFGW
jgi:hypothetical protein